MLDTSVLIAAEKQRLDLARLLAAHGDEPVYLAAIAAAELLHGMERADTPERRQNRSRFVESLLAAVTVMDFDLPVARRHAALWAELESAGRIIGAHDLQIAATALHHDCALATLNRTEFLRVPGLRLIDPTPYLAN
ncbi:MAG: PIN domain-containing protein [Opitutaceae bacterium]|nr:PIN domain-containing protein [Opitutaceae bacterium]